MCRNSSTVSFEAWVNVMAWQALRRTLSSSQPAIGLAWIVTFSIRTGSLGLFFRSTSIASILANVAKLSSPMTRPNTVLSPSRCGALSNVMKNCDPFVPGPLLAIDSTPRVPCRSAGRISSSNAPPHMLRPPLGFSGGFGVAGAPVCAINLEMRRWNGDLS